MTALHRKLPFVGRTLPGIQTGKIGLDLGLEKINMVQIDKQNSELTIRSAVSLSYPAESSSRRLFLKSSENCKFYFRKILREYNFKGRSAVSTLPADQVKLILVNYETNDSVSEQQLIVNAVKKRSNEDLDGSLIDYVSVNPRRENQSDQSALVAIADKPAVLDYLELMRQCGLQVERLEIGPIAINRLLCSMHKERRDAKVLAINFGTKTSYLTVTWGRRLLLDRAIDFGLDQAVEALSKALEMKAAHILDLLEQYGFENNPSSSTPSSAEDREIRQTLTEILKPLFKNLAAKINEVLVYTAAETRGGAIEQIVLFGSIARWAGTDRIIDKMISLPVTTINPFFGISVNQRLSSHCIVEPTAGIAVATGLALQGMLDDA